MKGNIGASDVQQRSGSNAYFNPYSTYSYSPFSASLVKTEVRGHAGATLNVTAGQGVKAKEAIADTELTGVETINESATEVVSTEIYSVNGAKLNDLQKGINIVKTTYADGSIKTKKVVVR